MTNQQLVDYIRQQLQQGIAREAIKSTLLSVGWHEYEIEEAFKIVLSQTSPLETSTPIPSYPSTLLSGTDLLRNAWRILKPKYKTFIGIMLIPILTGIALAIIGVVIGGGLILGATSLFGDSLPSPLTIIGFILFIVILVLISTIIQIWNQTALIYAIKDRDENIGAIEAYQRGWHKIISYWWIGFLSAFIITGGYLLFIIPGIIFSIWFSLATYVLIAEDIKGMNALLKSREYVRGRWLSVFWRFLVFGLFLLALLLIVAFILIMVGALGVFLSGSSFTELITSPDLYQSSSPLEPILSVLEYVLGAAISLLLTPFAFIYSFLVYENLRALKGTFTFTPSRRAKFAYLATGFFGFAVILGFLVFLFTVVSIDFFRPRNMENFTFPTIGETPNYPTLPPIPTITPQSLEERRDRQRESDMLSFQTGLEIYYSVNNGVYPTSLDQLTPRYMLRLPLDPQTGKSYDYYPLEDGENYYFCVDFESKERECLKSSTIPTENLPQ